MDVKDERGEDLVSAESEGEITVGCSIREGSPHGRSIALISNFDFNLYHYRRPLIDGLRRHGWKIYAIAPLGNYAAALEDMTNDFIPWRMNRSIPSPWGTFNEGVSLVRILSRIRPTIVQSFTLKPFIYGPIAGRLARAPVVINTLTGLGYLFTGDSWRLRILRRAVSPIFRLSSALADAVTFQNRDDMSVFVEHGLVSTEKARVIRGGSGVDTGYFSPDAVPHHEIKDLRRRLDIPSDVHVVLLATRMLWQKGVGEFVECARAIRRNCDTRFLLVGPVDEDNRAAIPLKLLTAWHEEGAISYLGFRDDVRELMALSDVVVLPSYREGMPRVLLEALAMGKPIITTDTAGCRDTVDEGVNGHLVPVQDIASMTDRLENLLSNSGLRDQFGRASRTKAVAEFDQAIVVAGALSLYEELLSKKN